MRVMRGIHNTWAPLAAFAIAGTLLCFDSAKADGQIIAVLLGGGKLDPALHDIRARLSSNPNDSLLLNRLGDVLYRRANFEGAEEAYRAALRANAKDARGYWGLGRLAQLNSRNEEAGLRFQEAFERNPHDPDILLSYAEHATRPGMRTKLLEEFLKRADPGDVQRREHVASQIIVAQRLNGRTPMEIAAGSGQAHRIPLMVSGVASGPRGLLVQVRINGAKPARLLLDSGAEGVYINERSARKLNLELLVEMRVGGFGSDGHATGQLSVADRMTIGSLEFENSMVRVLDLDWLSDADGVIGTDVFKEFQMRIDPRKRAMELTPYPDAPVPEANKMYRVGHHLLVRGSANGRAHGYFLLDTGASASLLSKEAAMDVVPKPFGWDGVQMRGVRGELPGVTSPARVKVAGREWHDPGAIAVDLEHISRQAGVELLGVLGYPLLAQAVLTIDYRDGLVVFERY